jgi:hypothetical protein
MIQDDVPAGSCGMDLLARMRRLVGVLEPDVELKDPETRKGDKRKKSVTSVGVAFNMYY